MADGHTRSIGGSSDVNIDTKTRLQASLTLILVSIFPPSERLQIDVLSAVQIKLYI